MKRGVGRPRIENANTCKLAVRVNLEILMRLDAYCKTYGKSKGEAVRAGLLMLFEAEENKQK